MLNYSIKLRGILILFRACFVSKMSNQMVENLSPFKLHLLIPKYALQVQIIVKHNLKML